MPTDTIHIRRLMAEHAQAIMDALPDNDNPTTRDWSAFIAALLNAFKQIWPVIGPIFFPTA